MIKKLSLLVFLLLPFLFIPNSCKAHSNEAIDTKGELDEEVEIIIPTFAKQPESKCLSKNERTSLSCTAVADDKVVYYKWYKTDANGELKIPLNSEWTNSSVYETAPIIEKGIQYYICAASTIKDDDTLTKSILSEIVVVFYSDLPVITIDTVDSEEPIAEYVKHEDYGGNYGAGLRNHTKPGARMKIIRTIDNNVIYDSGEYIKKECGLTIKLRGNTSAYSAKKPYKIKLQKKADLLADLVGRSDSKYKDKDWILLKDGDSLNTFIGFAVADIAGISWTPEYAYVNLIMNGEYRGIYMLVEAINQSKKRVDVADDGYIIERDAYWWNEDVKFITNLEQKYTFKYPDSEDIQQEQIDFIENYMNLVEVHIQDGTYEDYIDTDSFARWQLVHDILGTWDSCGSNIYMTKYDSTSNTDPNESGEWSKIIMSTPWDFDTIYYMKDAWANVHGNNRIYSFLLFNNTNNMFKDSYKVQWNNLCNSLWPNLNNALESLNSTIGDDINIARMADTVKWNAPHNSVEQDIDLAEAWFASRKVWLDDAIYDL